jgi:hypothetical protein
LWIVIDRVNHQGKSFVMESGTSDRHRCSFIEWISLIRLWCNYEPSMGIPFLPYNNSFSQFIGKLIQTP